MSEICVCGHQYGVHSPRLPMCLGGDWCECLTFVPSIDTATYRTLPSQTRPHLTTPDLTVPDLVENDLNV